MLISLTPSGWIFAVLISLALHAKLESERLSAFVATCNVVKFMSNGLAAKVLCNAPRSKRLKVEIQSEGLAA
ncbi:hypothetical protein [Saccharicrinis sp. FJH65]|uniref:hypothetical protein n=1 Tax=Saccharicrinis sp. FJH65 TaxID=3344659 RepID=UPI0036D2E492